MRTLFVVLKLIFLVSFNLNSQTTTGLISGPMLTGVELRNAVIWLEVSKNITKVDIVYYPKANPVLKKLQTYRGELGNEFNPIKIELNGLDINTTYAYQVRINDKEIKLPYPTEFVTKDLWQFRKPAPDFTFLTGSCSYFNQPAYDRPGKPYGEDSSIFEIMAAIPAQLHIWMGDNWYTREVDFFTKWGLNYRASITRSQPILQRFLASTPQYAIWDDHDYGPNNANKSYILKDESRRVFMNYWGNPSYGEENKGIYSKISYSDVDFYLLDDRFFRDADEKPDSINGLPNPNKLMFGEKQLQWLENEILTSYATFKIILVGSQVLNPISKSDCLRHYPQDFNELLRIILQNKINGVLFFSGDRHQSEVIKHDRLGTYSLYDVTVSPYSAGTHKFSKLEANNPARIIGIDEKQNFGKVSVTGERKNRILKVEFIGLRGEKLGEWSVNEKELKF